MENNNLVSIIIPCYNQAQYLEEAVQSAIEQTYPNIEIIIVNDGSSDNTQEVAERLQKQHPNILRIVTQKNQGLSEARNSGIRESLGKYILPLDADDKLDVHMVEKCIHPIQESHADIVYTGYQGFGVSENGNLWKPFEETNPLYITPCSATALYKKEVWKTTGGYSAVMHDGYEDWEFWVNAYKHNCKFKHIPEKLFLYRTKEESMYINAYKKDAYLKAKIVLLHPEMYPVFRLQRSIDIVKKTEELADLYFYMERGMTTDSKVMELGLDNYLKNNDLKPHQTIHIAKKTFELYSLENFNEEEEIEQLLNSDTIPIIFYSQICNSVPKLKNCNFSWLKDKGIVEANGTIFPYVFKSQRQDPVLQNIACERLERSEAFNQDRIRNFLHNAEVSNKKLSNWNLLMESLTEFIQQSTLKNPLQKIKAYKKFLYLYRLYRPTRITIEENDNNILFIVDSTMKNTQIAFYIYKNDIRIDTQWHSKNFSYKLDRKKYGRGKYRIQYFITNENDKDPGNSDKKEIGYSEYVTI